jgi:hypothetical protein
MTHSSSILTVWLLALYHHFNIVRCDRQEVYVIGTSGSTLVDIGLHKALTSGVRGFTEPNPVISDAPEQKQCWGS